MSHTQLSPDHTPLQPTPAEPAASDAAPADALAPAAETSSSGTELQPAVGAGESAPPGPDELLRFVQGIAADRELVDSLPLDPTERTWLRLEGPGGAEAWLIGWPPGTGTGWHDHGGSIGAFTTARGRLTEDSLAARLPTEGWRLLELAEGVDRRRALDEGRGRAFGGHHVHDVGNLDEAHAVSVHAYYPPLPLMRRYSRVGRTLRVEQVERPAEWE